MKNSELTHNVENEDRALDFRRSLFFILNSQFSIQRIVVAFVALCLINNVVLPVFEASDEVAHFRYADYLASERRLPDLKHDLPSHEVTQPPLYYVVVALAISPFDRSQLAELSHLNPDWFDKSLNADYKSVRPLHLHTSQEYWPWSSTVWAVHIGRLVSMVLGTLTVFFTYKIALEATRQSSAFSSQLSAFLTAILVAFNPKFIHMSSIVNNDGAITLAATVACWWMVRMWRMERGAKGEGRRAWSVRREAFVLGVLMGVAMLCKLSGIGLLLPAIFTVVLAPRSTPDASRLTPHTSRLTALLSGFAIIAGPWLLFNQINYGNPLAWEQVQTANAALLRMPPLSIREIITTLPQILESYWGVLGIELHYPAWINGVFYAALALAVGGWVSRGVRGKVSGVKEQTANVREARHDFQLSTFNFQLSTLLMWELALLGSYTLWLRSYVGTENGRLILPGVAPVALLMVMGWMALVPAKWHRGMALCVSGGLFALSLLTPFWIIRPAFAAPTFLSEVERAKFPAQADYTFGNRVQLLHAEVGTPQRDQLPITLYWQALDKIDQSYRVDLRVIDVNGNTIGTLKTLPYHGQFATTQWSVGQAFRDDYIIPFHALAPTAARVELRLYQQYPQPGFVPIDNGNDSVLLGRVRVGPPSSASNKADPPLALFGQSLALRHFAITDENRLHFGWLCRNAPDKDYALFVHVFDAANTLITQFDGPPYNGEYPTSLCANGDIISDTRDITLPAHATRIQVGWYDASSGTRLPALRPDGTRWLDDSVIVWERKTEFNLPPGFNVKQIATGFKDPTAFAFVPDGRIFIAEKSGLVKQVRAGVIYGQPVLDLRNEVNDFVDRGLIGMAIDPDFIRNGQLYLLYAYDGPTDTPDGDSPRTGRLVRYTLNQKSATEWGDTARRNSAKILLDDFQSDTMNHSVGSVRFASDGNLFVSLGEGALSATPDQRSLRAQQLDNIQGKILRLNQDGNGVPGNPFFDRSQPRSARSRIWAYGFRNPFRFALHPQNNIPYVGNVGWITYESLDRAVAGANFGWPCVEGTLNRPEFQPDPLCKDVNTSTVTPSEFNYPHANSNASITGGAFNIGNNFPASMRGNLFFGDYSTQIIYRAELDAAGHVSNVSQFASQVGEPVDFAFGPDGALYYLSIYSRGLIRIGYGEVAPIAIAAPVQINTRPIITITQPTDGDVFQPGEIVTLQGNSSISRSLQTWRVTLQEGRTQRTLFEGNGNQASFSIPNPFSSTAKIDVLFSSTSPQGEVGAQRLTLYAPPLDGYIRSWWLIGGFPYLTLSGDAIGEKDFVTPLADKRAQSIHSDNFRIDFAQFITPREKQMAYAFVWVDVPADRTGLLGINSDDGVAVWLNGQEVWRNDVHRYVPKPGEPEDLRDIDLPPITLKKGRNALLVKVSQDVGDWVFKLRVLKPDGSLMRDTVARMQP